MDEFEYISRTTICDNMISEAPGCSIYRISKNWGFDYYKDIETILWRLEYEIL